MAKAGANWGGDTAAVKAWKCYASRLPKVNYAARSQTVFFLVRNPAVV